MGKKTEKGALYGIAPEGLSSVNISSILQLDILTA
jgi:hypothetical protein